MDIASKMFETTQRIFSNWMALKLIVESDMGSRDDMQIFTEYVAELLQLNDELVAADVSYELENYVVSKFNTEIDDGSYIEIAEELLRFYSYIKNNDQATLETEIQKLSPLQSWLTVPQPQVRRYVAAESSDEDSENNEAMEVDEWVTVKSKKKGNK